MKPTGRLIFFALSRIRYLPAHNGSPPQILVPEKIQLRLLELLKIDPAQPRWTTASTHGASTGSARVNPAAWLNPLYGLPLRKLLAPTCGSARTRACPVRH
ncbi:hypothetical protein ABIE67_009679 [Streptomyces sp. V4I8]|uniref:hypothetical protein n=1 Tax=Streptomyces sp. V4I8 TaxID=3156469 RepID=UPI003518E81B